MRMLLTRPGEYSRKWIVHQRCQKPLHRRSIVHASGRMSHLPPRKSLHNPAGDHDDEVARVEPEELFPRVFSTPVLPNLFDKTAAHQGFINQVDGVRRDHEPEREDQRNVHSSVDFRMASLVS